MNRTLKILFSALIIISAVVIVVSFFMPWARVDVSATKVSGELVSAAAGPLSNSPFAGKFIKGLKKTTDVIGALGDIEIKTTISGYDIPTMLNKHESKTAISLGQIFFKDTKDLDKKSLAVYLLPLFAIACIALAVAGLKSRIAIITMFALSGAISGVGLYKLFTVNLSNLVVQIVLERGLWQTMYSYLTIAVISALWIVLDIKASRK